MFTVNAHATYLADTVVATPELATRPMKTITGKTFSKTRRDGGTHKITIKRICDHGILPVLRSDDHR